MYIILTSNPVIKKSTAPLKNSPQITRNSPSLLPNSYASHQLSQQRLPTTRENETQAKKREDQAGDEQPWSKPPIFTTPPALHLNHFLLPPQATLDQMHESTAITLFNYPKDSGRINCLQ